MTRHQRLWIAVSATFMANGGIYGVWASRIPAVAQEFQLEHNQLGLLLLLLAGGAILSFPIAGRLADRHGALEMSKLFILGVGVSMLALSFVTHVWVFTLAVFLFGMTQGAMDVAMNTWASEVERSVKKPWMPSFHAMWSLSGALGGLSGYLAVTLGLSFSWHFAIAAVAVPVLCRWGMNVKWQSKKTQSAPGPMFPIPRGPLFFVGLTCLCATFGEGTMIDWSAIYMIEIVGTDENIAPIGFVAFSAAMVLMRLFGGVVITTLGVTRAALFSGISALIGILVVVGLATPITSIVGFIFMGLGFALAFPLAITSAGNHPTLPQAQAIASVTTLGYGGLLLAPPVIGFVASATSLRGAFGLLIGMSVLLIALAPAMRGGSATAEAAPANH